MTRHILKTWPDSFQAVSDGAKTFELRRDDRGFAVGDVLVLQEYEPGPDRLTGRTVERRVSHVLRDCPWFGLLPGYAVLSFEQES